ncbi:hypothetical protein [Streptomyces werraensis]|uniref:hypothetical protein n=1 Tax=Streptomyces werraensis TaxID=68284 RepID=UPI0037FFA810
MRTRTTAVAVLFLAAAATLTACEEDTTSSKPSTGNASATPSPETKPAQEQKDTTQGTSSIPAKPTGAKRQQLLDALAEAAPDVVRYEDKAIDAARNQCSAINNGANRINWMASQRFTYKDVTTTEAQGKAINEVLQTSGFCNV